MKRSFSLFVLMISLSTQIFAQSPFGTGKILNQNIGQIGDENVIVASESGFGFFDFFPSAQQLLQDYNYDIYVPDDYDGTEEYGLVVFINSGNNGGFKDQWLPVLDDKKLIWISGDDIGNSIFINIRMGVGMAAALRMQELFNIDTNRIYTSGNSGGARMAHNLAFIYPETFIGAMPSCGGSYIREVAQDYETQNPDDHYEAILDYPSDYLDYLLPFDQRFANMTSYNDFREGDIMNIYHNGSEQDGLKGKFLETAGNHCATTTAHFLDAINFVEHPFITVIEENFDGTTDIPFKMTNAGLANSFNLQMGHNMEHIAQIQSEDLFLWDDPMGAIFETSVQINANNFNMNTNFHLGFWSMNEPTDYCGFIGNQLEDGQPAILLTMDFTDAQPTLMLLVENPAQPDMEVLFTSTFSDWDINTPLAIKYHLWDEELRVELGAHLLAPTFTETGVRLLDDMRSIRIRWNDIATDFWEDSAWEDGAFLTLFSEKNEIDQAAANMLINRVELITANTDIGVEIPQTSSSLTANICTGDSYEFNDEMLSDAGLYEATFVNAQGCDSIVTLDLIIDPLPLVTISETNGTISADMDFESYQWYHNDVLLDDETEANINPSENGNYYVEVTDVNGCHNTSNIINFMVTSIATLESYGITVSPNPTARSLIINTNGVTFKSDLFDLSGKRIMSNLKAVNDLSNLANGTYLLKLQIEADILMVKVQKVD